MKLPLVILAVLAVVTGFVPFGQFVSSDGSPLAAHFNLMFSIAPVGLALLAILIAANLYKKENNKPAKMASAFGGLYNAAVRKFYIDELYLFITKKVLFNLVGRPAAWFDKHVVDGFVNGTANVTATTSHLIKGVQSGKVQSYAIYFFGGVIALAALFIYYWN